MSKEHFIPTAPADLRADGLSVPDAANVCLIIFLHGSEGESEPDDCIPAISPAGTVPPVVGALFNKSIHGKRVLLYAPCSLVAPGWTKGQPREQYKFFKRGIELAELLIETEAAGYRRENIIVTGQSAGGWIALTHLAQNPGAFAGVVAFAPAFAGRGSGHLETEHSGFWVPERESQVAILGNATPLPCLVYSFEGCEFEPPNALRSIFKNKEGAMFRAMGQMPAAQCTGGRVMRHNGAYHPNFVDQEGRILEFVNRVVPSSVAPGGSSTP
jgi:predicted esterase